MVSFTLLAALRKPSPFDWIANIAIQTNRPEAESDDDLRFRSLVGKFDQFAIDEKLYAQEGVSLQSTARLFDVPKRQLSRAINHVHGESFSKRMNRMRVIEAKRLLLDPARKSVTGIMLDSGFRTKSNFNKEFLAIEGLSPSDFREAAS